MSLRSGINSDYIFRNLKVNGTLTLSQELTVDTLDVGGGTQLEDLNVNGDTTLNTLEVSGSTHLEDLIVLGDANLNTLEVSGTTNLGTTDVTSSKVTSKLTTTGEFDLDGNIKANGATVTPQQLGFVSGATSNLQSQINGKAPTYDPTFTGTVNMPTTRFDAYAYYKNVDDVLPVYTSNCFGAIASNMSGGADFDFVNMGHFADQLGRPAFDWYLMTSSTVKELLMRVYNSGELWVSGLINAVGGLTTTTLTATEHSQLADVSSNSLTVTGDLHVTGQINAQSNMEVVTYHLTGDATKVYKTIGLHHNTTNTTNYIVIPSIYYGFSGSGGTYNPTGTSGSVNEIVISNITDSSFQFNLMKDDGDNVNLYLTFLVVYGVQGSNYPKSYD